MRELDRPLAIALGGVLIPLGGERAPGPVSVVAWLVPWGAGSLRRGVMMLARADGMRVNGRPVLPVTALRRGDEIRVDGVSLFYTDEAPLRVVPYDPAGGTTPTVAECTRCHGPISPGEPVVVCPVCAAVYMAQPDRTPNCWTFGPCLSCGRDPSREFIWQPAAARVPEPWHQRAWRTRARSVT